MEGQFGLLVFLHVVEMVSVMLCHELNLNCICCDCVQVRLEEFSFLSLSCSAIESQTHMTQFCAGFVLMRM